MSNVNCIVDHYLKDIKNDDTCIWKYPIYSSNIIIELWKDNSNYTIQILFNGQKRKIPFCNYSYECPLQKFKEWHNSFIVDDPLLACGLGKPENNFIGIVIFLIIVILVLIGYIVFIKFRRNVGLKKQDNEKYEENFEEKDQEF